MNKSRRFNLPLTLSIDSRLIENPKTVTLIFRLPLSKSLEVLPGQYFMLWVPDLDEIPVSVSNYSSNKISFTICNVGSASEALVTINESQLIGLRGPFGNGFSINHNKNVLLIAGGIGIAPLRFLLYYFLSNNSKRRIVLIQGAKTESELIYKAELERLSIEKEFCTEDGSFGFKGFPTSFLGSLLETEKIKTSNWEIYTCGPEIMMKNILNIIIEHDLADVIQFSLADRYIRCGFGICGSCFLDDLGLSICMDGPVFSGSLLQKVSDFGKFGRNQNGSKYLFVE